MAAPPACEILVFSGEVSDPAFQSKSSNILARLESSMGYMHSGMLWEPLCRCTRRRQTDGSVEYSMPFPRPAGIRGSNNIADGEYLGTVTLTLSHPQWYPVYESAGHCPQFGSDQGRGKPCSATLCLQNLRPVAPPQNLTGLQWLWASLRWGMADFWQEFETGEAPPRRPDAGVHWLRIEGSARPLASDGVQ